MKRLLCTPLLCLLACSSQPAVALGTDLAGASDLSGGASGGDMSPPDLTVPLDLLADLALPSDLGDQYPAGPYGSKVGDTIGPLAWEGYKNPSAMGLAENAPYGALTMNDLRRSGKKFGLLYGADYF